MTTRETTSDLDRLLAIEVEIESRISRGTIDVNDWTLRASDEGRDFIINIGATSQPGRPKPTTSA